MSKDKIKIEKVRQDISKRYKDEISELKETKDKLAIENKKLKETLSKQQETIDKLVSALRLLNSVCGINEVEIKNIEDKLNIYNIFEKYVFNLYKGRM